MIRQVVVVAALTGWAISAGAQGPLRGITFLDAAGEGIFGVYLPESADPKPALKAQFDKTRAVIAGLPRVCS